MHVSSFSEGAVGANGIVGGGIAHAVGLALAAQTLGKQSVAVAFFGDGAANQGVLFESLNLAALWQVPVLFVCENNGFTGFPMLDGRRHGGWKHLRARGHLRPPLRARSTETMWSPSTWPADEALVHRARNGGGPERSSSAERTGGAGTTKGRRAMCGPTASRPNPPDPTDRLEEAMAAAGLDAAQPAEQDRTG